MNAVHKLNQTQPNSKVIKYDFVKKQLVDTDTKKEKYTIKEGKDKVQPLRTEEYILNAKKYFLNKPERYKNLKQNIRDYTIFVFGINLARRCGDLLHLRVHNVLDENYNIKTHIIIHEQKTGKTAKLIITPIIKEALMLYLETLNDIELTDPLFPSRNIDKNLFICSKCGKGSRKQTYYCEKKTYPKGQAPKICGGFLNPNKNYGNKNPMTVTNFYLKMQDLKRELEIVDPIGTHSMRKTWTYMTINKNPNDARVVAKVSKALGHNNIETTFAYAGFAQEEMDETFMKNQL